jgi:hypothetical protein
MPQKRNTVAPLNAREEVGIKVNSEGKKYVNVTWSDDSMKG